jgi:hypothetical protein
MDITAPANAAPAFLTSAGSDDQSHAKATVDFYNSLFKVNVPADLHIYAHGGHGGGIRSRNGIPFGTWPRRFEEWLTDLGMLNQQPTGTGVSFKGPIGLQLYSLRDQFAKDVPKTLDQVRSFGIVNVELAGTYGMTPEKFKAQLDAKGLKPISGHFSYEQFRDRLDDVIRDAKTFGLQYVGCAWIPHDKGFDEACSRCRRRLQPCGRGLAKNGMKFFYHIHGYEFSRMRTERCSTSSCRRSRSWFTSRWMSSG